MVKYSICKHKQLGCYVLFKESKTKNGLGVKGIYQGSKKECEEQKEILCKENI